MTLVNRHYPASRASPEAWSWNVHLISDQGGERERERERERGRRKKRAEKHKDPVCSELVTVDQI